MELVDNKVILLRTRRPERITDVVNKSAIVGRDGDLFEVAVHWGLKESKQLAKLKVKDVPSPIKRDYSWTGKFKPFDHQKETSSFLTLHDKAFCFNEQGTGKTGSVIWAADYLMNIGEVNRVLVLCPLSIMKSAWQQDLFKFAMHRSCSVAHGDSTARKKIINAGCDFVIINFDGAAIVKKEILEGGFDLVVVDEATSYKNPQTNRWKILKDIVAQSKRLWMLTGTPASQSPVDAYGIAKLVNPENTPKFFGQFRDQVMYKVSQYRWAAKPQAKEIVHRVLQPAIRFEKDQCLDLPDVTYVDRDAPLTAQQLKYYDLLKRQMTLTAAEETVTAVNAATNINKLLQISGGAVYSDTKEVIEFDVSNRIQVILEVIQESSHKVLVFVPFTHTIDLLQRVLEKIKFRAG